MSFGIQIAVDARKVVEAKKSVADLGSTLADLSKTDVSLGGETLSRDAEILRQASMDITRLGNLSRSGEARGGLLGVQQWKDAALLSKRVGENLEGWVKQSQKLREELKRVNEDLEGLNKASMDPSLSSGTRQAMLDEIVMLRGQKSDLEKEIAGRGKGDARADYLRGRAAEYSGNITGYGSTASSGAQDAALGRIGNLVKTVAVLAGGAGLLSMIHRSVETYKERESTGADLGAVGLEDSAAGDYLFGERTQAKMALARRTGFGSSHFLRLAGRARGVASLDSMVDFAGGTYRATGMGEGDLTNFTAGIFATTANTKRQVDILESIQKLLAAQAQQQGGAVGREQASYLAGLFNNNFEKNVMLQGTGIYDKLNAGISAGGKNPGERLLLWKLAGGDLYNGSFEALNLVQANMAEGISNPTVRKNLRGWMTSNLGSRAQRIAFLHSMFGLSTRRGGEAELALDNILSRDPSHADAIANAKEESWASSYRGSTTRRLALMSEETRVRAGASLGPGLQKLEEGMLRIGDNFLDKVAKIHSAGDAIREGGEFIKNSVKTMWDDSGPFGKMLVLLGGIYTGIKLIGLGTKTTDFAKELGGGMGAVGRFIGGGVAAAGVGYGAYKGAEWLLADTAVGKGKPGEWLYDMGHDQSGNPTNGFFAALDTLVGIGHVTNSQLEKIYQEQAARKGGAPIPVVMPIPSGY